MQCMKTHRGTDRREMLPACLPFSQPEEMKGAWVYGFETNQFYENERASGADLRPSG